MKKEEKNQIIEKISTKLKTNNHFYITDISGLTVEEVNKLRALCFKRNVELIVVKNTLLKKAMERLETDFSPLYSVLHGPTSIMFSNVNNVPAKLIKEFRKKYPKPILKGAYVEQECYIGEDKLDILENIKSKEELIGMVVTALRSPIQNVVSALNSAGSRLAGAIEVLAEKKEKEN